MAEVLDYLAPHDPPTEDSGVGMYEFVQDDGAKWHSYYDERDPDGHYLIVTSIGREMIHGYGGMEPGQIRENFIQYLHTTPDSDGEMHDFLGAGQQATVYGMGGLVAVREEDGKRPFFGSMSELTVMDQLSSVVEGGLPRWLSVPHYYAHYCDPEQDKQFTLMERIDAGLTVEDVITYPDNVQPNSNKRAETMLHGEVAEHAEEVNELYFTAKEILEAVIRARGQKPDELLLDWAPRNVLVERLRTPLAGKNFKLSIIDQN